MQTESDGGAGAPGSIAVLLVDDEPDLLDVAQEYLSAFPELRVHAESSAEAGLAFLRGGQVDAIVSDYEMEGTDGIAFLKILRGKRDATPFILFTGRGRESVAMEALNSGADFYLMKGSDPVAVFAELRNMIGQAVMRRRAQEEARALADRVEQQAQVLDEILSSIPDPVLILDPGGSVTYANLAGARILGFARMAILGRPFGDLPIPPGARDPLLAAAENVISTGQRAEAEIPWSGDGRPERYRCSAAPLHAATGRINAVAILFRDVTGEKKLADDLDACRLVVDRLRGEKS